MSNIRVHALAAQLGISSAELIEELAKLGVKVKTSSSSVDEETAEKLGKKIGGKTANKKPAEKKPKASPAATKAKPAKKTASAPKATRKKPVTPAEPHPETKTEVAPDAKKAVEPKPVAVAPAPVQKAEPAQKPISPIAQTAPLAPKPVQHAPIPKTEPAKPVVSTAPAPVPSPPKPFQPKPVIQQRPAHQPSPHRPEHKPPMAQPQKAPQPHRPDRGHKPQHHAPAHKHVPRPAPVAAPLQPAEPPAPKKILLPETQTVKEFADLLGLHVNEVIKRLIMKGIMSNLNQSINRDLSRKLALEWEYEVEDAEELASKGPGKTEEEDASKLKLRAPVVTIMGHVDHGKTSLLDAIRETKVTEKEAGGITQHIGAYEARMMEKKVVFLDTPGHEAFTAMRARGAQATDIVVLVVAADDGVMPQTLEAIHHAKAANVPIIVAVNKIDKPEAQPDRVKTELSKHELVPEEWGGKTIFVQVSAKKRIGIDDLMEMILLQAEVMELKANPDRRAEGVVVEAKLDKGRGPVATVLIQKGTLSVGDAFVVGNYHGKVRAMLNDHGARMTKAGPATPVEILGIDGVPSAGDTFKSVETEREARQIAMARQAKQRTEGLTKPHVTLDMIHHGISSGELKELNIVLKADVQGSLEAISEALGKLGEENVRIRIIHGAGGGITESDVMLAAASDAIIVGFNVRPTDKAEHLALQEKIDIRLYNVIYDAINNIESAIKGMLSPKFREKTLGKADVRQTFNITKVGTIAGCMVTGGLIRRTGLARLVRDSVVIYQGKLSSLKRFKDDVREVASGYECGIGIENYNDLKIGDVIECYIMEEIRAL